MQSSRRAVGTLLSGILLLAATAWAAPASRISQPIDSRRMTTLRGNVHPMARAEFDQGALDPSRMLHRVTISFNRTAAQQQALDKLVAEQQDPKSASYHQWLTPEQFAAQFGMAPADIAKVKDWLGSQGFTIDEVARGGSYIAFSGSAGQVSAAFQTEIHQYSINGEVHFANATSPAVPSAMADVVSSIRGLNDFKPRARVRIRHAKPNFTSSLSGNTYLAPDDFATIYDLNALYSSGIDGTGQKIAVMGQTDILQSDITTFRSVSNLPANSPQVILVPNSGDPGVSDGDIGEADLDLEWSGAVARKATIIYVNSGNGAFDSLYYAIDNSTAPIISISYGECEADEVNSGYLSSDQNMLQQANSQGQEVVGPAGDDGAADCDFPLTANAPPINSATQGLAVDFPASSPFVTGVGGTTFNEGSSAYWSSVNDVSQGSALFYIPEVVWNDTAASVAVDEGFSSTGGGASMLFVKPTWQTGVGVPSDGMRDVPDVALAGSPSHDGFITCSQGSCQVCVTTDANCATSTSPGYRSSADDTLDVVGGTSAGVPTFAGMLALVNQKLGAAQGNVNQQLYTLAAGQTGSYIFHDITSGNNEVPCTTGTVDCPNGGEIGFSAGTGYDQTTGLGSVDGYNLVSNWSAPATADFGVSFFNPTLTLAAGSSSTILVTLRRENGFNGTVNLSCTSAFNGVTCSVSPSIVNPDAVATVTITASSTASLRVPHPNTPLMPWWESGIGVAAFFGMGAGKKRSKRRMVLMALLLVALIIGLASCGGGGGSSSTGTGGSTTGGTSGTVTLQATSGGLTHSTALTVTVN